MSLYLSLLHLCKEKEQPDYQHDWDSCHLYYQVPCPAQTKRCKNRQCFWVCILHAVINSSFITTELDELWLQRLPSSTNSYLSSVLWCLQLCGTRWAEDCYTSIHINLDQNSKVNIILTVLLYSKFLKSSSEGRNLCALGLLIEMMGI